MESEDIINSLLLYMDSEKKNKIVLLNKIKDLIEEYEINQLENIFIEIVKLAKVFIKIYGEHDLNINGIMIF